MNLDAVRIHSCRPCSGAPTAEIGSHTNIRSLQPADGVLPRLLVHVEFSQTQGTSMLCTIVTEAFWRTKAALFLP